MQWSSFSINIAHKLTVMMYANYLVLYPERRIILVAIIVAQPPLYMQYHKRYLEQCKYHGDNDGAGNAYEALSRSYERWALRHTFMCVGCM